MWFAPEDDRRFYRVSDPATQHSRNLAVRPRLSRNDHRVPLAG